MKKIVTMVVLLMAVTMTAQAQLKFGVKGGLNLTNMKLSESVVDKSNQTGFFIGPTIKFTLPVVGIGIDAAALYDQRKSEIEDTDVKQQSVQIPINVRFGFGLGDTASLYIFAGPQFGFNVGDKDFTIKGVQNYDYHLKSSNLSANVGLGLMLLSHLQVSANYNIALGNTGEADVVSGVKEAFDAKTNAWQLSLAYYF